MLCILKIWKTLPGRNKNTQKRSVESRKYGRKPVFYCYHSVCFLYNSSQTYPDADTKQRLIYMAIAVFVENLKIKRQFQVLASL
jgi:hypothetical protein